MKAFLILEDGTIFEGRGVGMQGSYFGRLAFHTGMGGYQELITDPAMKDQLLVMTYPLIGNYGTNCEDNESSKAWARGVIMRECCEKPNNFRMEDALPAYMEKMGVGGIEGVDTRELTRILRGSGEMRGALIVGSADTDKKEEILDQIRKLEVWEPIKAQNYEQQSLPDIETGRPDVLLVDFGCTRSFIKGISDFGVNIKISKLGENAKELLAGVSGILLSGGPGSPEKCDSFTGVIKDLIASGLPIMAVGLSHNLVAKAMGFENIKLPYGHRGASNPVKDIKTGRTYITRQNHDFSVDKKSVDEKQAEISHVNLNDTSCEGIVYKTVNVSSFQFEPDFDDRAHATGHYFKDFISKL